MTSSTSGRRDLPPTTEKCATSQRSTDGNKLAASCFRTKSGRCLASDTHGLYGYLRYFWCDVELLARWLRRRWVCNFVRSFYLLFFTLPTSLSTPSFGTATYSIWKKIDRICVVDWVSTLWFASPPFPEAQSRDNYFRWKDDALYYYFDPHNHYLLLPFDVPNHRMQSPRPWKKYWQMIPTKIRFWASNHHPQLIYKWSSSSPTLFHHIETTTYTMPSTPIPIFRQLLRFGSWYFGNSCL